MYIDILAFGKDEEEHNRTLGPFSSNQEKKTPSTKASAIMARRSWNFWGMFSLTMAYRRILTMWKVWS